MKQFLKVLVRQKKILKDELLKVKDQPMKAENSHKIQPDPLASFSLDYLN
jgi:hypothetical protein